jgi:hypothetical protein
MTDTSNWQQATDNATENAAPNIEVSLPPYVRDDIRILLDHLETEYVGPTISVVMRRLRTITGYGN